MKASEIFLEYAEPARVGLPENVSVQQLKKSLMIPELVWNCVVLEKNDKQKPGHLPSRLQEAIKKDFPSQLKKQGTLLMNFWVQRKRNQFSDHNWLLTTEIYENLKKEVIVRVRVHGDDQVQAALPPEWRNKAPGTVLKLTTE
jgi:hypothetical protein